MANKSVDEMNEKELREKVVELEKNSNELKLSLEENFLLEAELKNLQETFAKLRLEKDSDEIFTTGHYRQTFQNQCENERFDEARSKNLQFFDETEFSQPEKCQSQKFRESQYERLNKTKNGRFRETLNESPNELHNKESKIDKGRSQRFEEFHNDNFYDSQNKRFNKHQDRKYHQFSNPFLYENEHWVPNSSIIRESLAVIPNFDGSDVFKFVRAVRRIKNQFPLKFQNEIIRLLKFKLSDRACLAVGNQEFYSIEEFLTRLKVVFATHRSSNYYRGQLSILAKKNDESILEYIERFDSIATAIIDSLCLEAGIDALPLAETQKLEKEFAQEFYFALPPFFRQYINKTANTITEAYDEAIKAEKRIEIDREKFPRYNNRELKNQQNPENKRNYNYRQNNSYPNQRYFDTNAIGNEPENSRNTYYGHRNDQNFDYPNNPNYSDNRNARQFRNNEFYDSRSNSKNVHFNRPFDPRYSRNQNSSYDQNNRGFPNIRGNRDEDDWKQMQCDYCKKYGHTVDKCFTRLNREKFENSGNFQDVQSRTDGNLNENRTRQTNFTPAKN